MDFTRQPIVESVITAKEGCKLVVRSSKGTGQEEYFVDAVEVVSFGHSFFFRSMEKPKSFLVPATDYEVLEVREARMVLKNVGSGSAVKIAGGKVKGSKESEEAPRAPLEEKEKAVRVEEKRRERRRSSRRRRSRSEVQGEAVESHEEEKEDEEQESKRGRKPSRAEIDPNLSTSVLKSLLPPPTTLISETIERYKGNDLFKDAFFEAEEQESKEEQKSEAPQQEHEGGDEESAEKSQDSLSSNS